MRNMWLVARREFVSRGKSGGYLVTTLLMIVMLLAITVLPTIMEGRGTSKPLNVQVLDKTGQLAAPLQAAMGQASAQPGARQISLETVTGDEADLTAGVHKQGRILLIIEGEFPAGIKARYLAADPASLDSAGAVMAPLEAIVRAARLQARGIDPAVTQEILQPMQTEVLQITETGEGRDQQGYVGSMLLAVGIVMVLYMVILLNGQFVFQGVLEEKVSRVMEVMASSVGPSEMLAGKVIGLGALGLLQFVGMMIAWAGGTVLANSMSDRPTSGVSWEAAALSFAFLVLGYLLSAVMMAAAASTISRMEDQQAVIMPITMLIALPMMMLGAILADPSSKLAVVMSLIPFFSQSVMVMRVLMTPVPAWQIVVSLGLMVVSTVFMVWAGGRIYRAAMLSYGSRPSFRQVLGYLRQ